MIITVIRTPYCNFESFHSNIYTLVEESNRCSFDIFAPSPPYFKSFLYTVRFVVYSLFLFLLFFFFLFFLFLQRYDPSAESLYKKNEEREKERKRSKLPLLARHFYYVNLHNIFFCDNTYQHAHLRESYMS